MIKCVRYEKKTGKKAVAYFNTKEKAIAYLQHTLSDYEQQHTSDLLERGLLPIDCYYSKKYNYTLTQVTEA